MTKRQHPKPPERGEFDHHSDTTDDAPVPPLFELGDSRLDCDDVLASDEEASR